MKAVIQAQGLTNHFGSVRAADGVDPADRLVLACRVFSGQDLLVWGRQEPTAGQQEALIPFKDRRAGCY